VPLDELLVRPVPELDEERLDDAVDGPVLVLLVPELLELVVAAELPADELIADEPELSDVVDPDEAERAEVELMPVEPWVLTGDAPIVTEADAPLFPMLPAADPCEDAPAPEELPEEVEEVAAPEHPAASPIASMAVITRPDRCLRLRMRTLRWPTDYYPAARLDDVSGLNR
jgi:hypothetical protein